MQIFTLKGYNGERITLNLKEVFGYPEYTSYEGGYDIDCTLEIRCGCYTVHSESYFSASGALYKFQNELIKCYELLEGSAHYALKLENDLIFDVKMKSGGHAVIEGVFQERPDKRTALKFEIETDQTCLKEVISGIEALKEKLHDEDKVIIM